MNFAETLKKESSKTLTENGATALNTTGDRCLDFFASGGSLRDADDIRIKRLFDDAYAEDSVTAVRTLWYIRDREGLGERKVFRNLINHCAVYHPETVRPNLQYIGEFGRWDDIYSLVGTPVEDEMWAVVKAQFEKDRTDMANKMSISLLAKWLKTADASSKETRKLGIYTAKKLGYSVYDYKRIVKSMRKYIKVVESLMSTEQWDKIEYSEVPSRAMMIYRNAFGKHDEKRFNDFTNKAVIGEAKINSSTLYPYDIVDKFAVWKWNAPKLNDNEKKVLEAQWRQLPNYVEEGTNAIVIADVSGSMTCSNGRPLATSIGLAIYFAERNKGDYHNLLMTFSDNSDIVELKGSTLEQKIQFVSEIDWGNGTNLHAAFKKILDLAIKNNTPPEDMPKSIIVVSDMEIDNYWSPNEDWTFYDTIKAEYGSHGYEIPNVIFWNVDSRHDIFHTDAKRKGVQLCSGQSATTFKHLMACIGMTPVEMMNKVVNSERYQCITIGR
jgi:hypothetical protein